MRFLHQNGVRQRLHPRVLRVARSTGGRGPLGSLALRALQAGVHRVAQHVGTIDGGHDGPVSQHGHLLQPALGQKRARLFERCVRIERNQLVRGDHAHRQLDELAQTLVEGLVDAIAAHESSLLTYEKDYGVTYRILDEPLLEVGLGTAFDINDTRGIDVKLTHAYQEMFADGTMERLVSKYFDDPSPFLNMEGLS